MPQSGQRKTDNDNAAWKFWRREELTDGKKVRDAGYSQGAMKDGPPLSPKVREQIVSATHKMAPSTYTLVEGVNFTFSGARPNCATACSHSLSQPPCVAPSPEPDATPLPAESGRQIRRYRKKDLRSLGKARELVRATGVSRARCWCPFRRPRKAWDEKSLPRPDSSLRRKSVPRPRHVRQAFERVFENRTRQMWTVAVEGNDKSLVFFCEVRKYRSKSCGKALTVLRNYACLVTRQSRQFLYVRVRAHDGNFYIAQRPRQSPAYRPGDSSRKQPQHQKKGWEPVGS